MYNNIIVYIIIYYFYCRCSRCAAGSPEQQIPFSCLFFGNPLHVQGIEINSLLQRLEVSPTVGVALGRPASPSVPQPGGFVLVRSLKPGDNELGLAGMAGGGEGGSAPPCRAAPRAGLGIKVLI